MEYYTIFSWGVFIFLAAGGVYIYNPGVFQKLITSAPAQTLSEKVASTTAPKQKHAKKQKSTQSLNSSAPRAKEDARITKKRKIAAPTNTTVSVVKTDGQKVELPRNNEDNVSDKEFAQQLVRAQAGTSIQSKAQQQAKGPSRLSASIQPKASEERLSTGVHDADDDLSSVDTPQQAKPSGKDVSDMLEPSAAAPTTLRVTSIPSEKPKSKAKPQQFEQVTSKKKRNEQARREEQKRINEESDRLHERKKQEQLRTARMAAGTSNQTKANNFTSTAQNAWQNKPPAANENAAQANTSSLLDTFQPTMQTQSSVQTQPLSNITNTPVASGNATELRAKQGSGTTSAFAASARERASFSEEEQKQRIREVQQEEEWESVQSKKSKKKSRKDNSSESSPPSTRSHSHSRASTLQTNGSKVNGAAKPTASSNRFAAVSTAGTAGLVADEWEA